RLDFSKADTIVSFGAGFLETWISPVEYARQWAATRNPARKGGVSQFVHVEPRLSMTAANADVWLRNAPGTDVQLLQALLKAVLNTPAANRGGSAARAAAERLVENCSIPEVLSRSGVERKRFEAVVKRLARPGTSLVVAGGAAFGDGSAVPAGVLAFALNAVLGNIGKTVLLYRRQSPRSSGMAAMAKLLEDMKQKDSPIGLLVIAGVNPSFVLPPELGFDRSLGNVPLIVALTTNLDETAVNAHLVLPASTSFESWGDSEPIPGTFALNQPAMQPLYESMCLGDVLIAVGAKLGQTFGEANDFHHYIRAQWQQRTGGAKSEEQWLDVVQRGGDFSGSQQPLSNWTFAQDVPALPDTDTPSGLTLIAFPTVRGVDGQTANRPWIQELPDPMTTVVWGSWVEMHPQTAERLKIKDKQVVEIRTSQGKLRSPVYLTKHLHPDALAMPLGNGHTGYGRYAAGVGVNPLEIMPASATAATVSLMARGVSVVPAVDEDRMVKVQGEDSQLKRGIVRWVQDGNLDHHLGMAGHGGGEHKMQGDM
ncbi:MAG: hypothetical protein KDD44_10720, partial [Bdellovibrionales bacterium]|nr:hypothetical protein [Bdellovibrionales bacterium]